MTGDELRNVLALYATLWPQWRVPDGAEGRVTADVWRQMLGDLPAPAVLAAVQQIANDGERWPPPVGVVRKAAYALAHPDERVPDLDEAWREVQAAVAHIGYTAALEDWSAPRRPDGSCPKVGDRLRWSHPAVAGAVRAFGWDELCESANPEAARAHFTRFYAAAADRARSDVALPAAVRQVIEDAAPRVLKRVP